MIYLHLHTEAVLLYDARKLKRTRQILLTIHTSAKHRSQNVGKNKPWTRAQSTLYRVLWIVVNTYCTYTDVTATWPFTGSCGFVEVDVVFGFVGGGDFLIGGVVLSTSWPWSCISNFPMFSMPRVDTSSFTAWSSCLHLQFRHIFLQSYMAYDNTFNTQGDWLYSVEKPGQHYHNTRNTGGHPQEPCY